MSMEVELREGPAGHAGLVSEAEVLQAVQYPMLPRVVASFEEEGRRYLALTPDAHDERGQSLHAALGAGIPVEQAISIVVQLAQVLRRLHAAGWALIGLTPADVVLGQPIRLTTLGSAARIGAPSASLFISGYSAPELAYGGTVSGKEDAFTLGAILYRALAGAPLPEQGAELATLPSMVPTPAAPQLLAAAVAPAEERIALDDFYRRLLAFKRRLGRDALTLQIASGTTIGLNPTREVNEDACGAVQWTAVDEAGADQRSLLCVVDGMGGMEAGEVASQTALRAVLSAAHRSGDGQAVADGGLEPWLDPIRLVQGAAADVHRAAAGRSVGATITCAVVTDGVLTLGHVGDTRAYLLRGGELRQLTHDHSLVAAMVASGVLTKEQARHHPESNKVLRALGSQAMLPESFIDTLEQTTGERTLPLREGDQLLLCSDGVWGQVEDDRLRAVLEEAIDPATAVQVILADVLKSGAPDNASVVVARCSRLPDIRASGRPRGSTRVPRRPDDGPELGSDHRARSYSSVAG
jgi:protein phosphatase